MIPAQVAPPVAIASNRAGEFTFHPVTEPRSLPRYGTPFQKPWSDHEDCILCDAIADGFTFAEAAKMLGGRSRDSCVGRFNRISAQMTRGGR